MYEDAFETKFLKATEALYHEEGNRYMQETDVSYHPFYNIQQWELHLLYFAVLSYFSCKKIFTPDKSSFNINTCIALLWYSKNMLQFKINFCCM